MARVAFGDEPPAAANSTGLIVAAVLMAWRSSYRHLSVLLCVVALALIYRCWQFLTLHFAWVYLLQQVGAYGLLAFTFGRTLLEGRVPLCTQWAARVHGQLTEPVIRYTRQVTAAWTLFFALMVLTLIALFMLAPLRLVAV